MLRRRARAFALYICVLSVALHLFVDPLTTSRTGSLLLRGPHVVAMLLLVLWLRRERSRNAAETAVSLVFAGCIALFGPMLAYAKPDNELPILVTVGGAVFACTAGMLLRWQGGAVIFVVSMLSMWLGSLMRERLGHGAVGQTFTFLFGSLFPVYSIYLFNLVARERGLFAEFEGREALRLANEQLQREQDVRSRLFVNLSHDFRTPLSVVRAEAEHVRARFRDLPELQSSLARIDANAAALVDLIEQLLELSRLEAGKTPVSPEACELAGLSREVAAQLAPARDDLRLVVEADGTPCHALIDAGHLRRILQNLVANALRQLTQAGGQVRIVVRVDEQGPLIDVVDDGPGIPAALHASLFERFASFRPEGSTASGIGLSLARELAELNGGTLELVAEAGHTTFRLRLPAAEHGGVAPRASAADAVPALSLSPAPLPAGSDRAHGANGTSGALPRPWVLVVEDHADLRASIERLLAPRFDVGTAASASAALGLLSSRVPSAIVCDIMLPDADGYTVLSYVKQRPRLEHVPVLLLSALSEPSERVRGLAAGADDYIVKPFSGAELVARVSSTIERTAERAALLDRQREDLQMELHDGVCGHLSRAVLVMEAANTSQRDPRLASALASVREGASEARGLLSSLSQPELMLSAFVHQLRWELTCACERAGLVLELSAQGSADAQALISAGVAHALRRIAHEAVTNVIKHASARTVYVALEAQPQRLRLRVADDGRGRCASGVKGHGLMLAHKRAARFGGTVSLSDCPQGGCVLEAVLQRELPRDGSVEAQET